MTGVTRRTWRMLGWASAAVATAGGVAFLVGAYRQTSLATWGFLMVLIGIAAMLRLLFTGVRRTHPPRQHLPSPHTDTPDTAHEKD